MSISPSDANSPAPSQFARARPPHPSSGHGSAPRSRNPAGNLLESPVGSPTESGRSPGSPSVVSPGNPGSDITYAGGSYDSSCDLNELTLKDYEPSSSTLQSGDHVNSSHLAAHKDEPSLIRSDQRRHHARGRKITGGSGYSQYYDMPAGGRNPHGNLTQPGGKKSQTGNANHLLNFYYDPIQRSQPRLPPPRKQQRIKPFNRELFLQANYKFVVLDTGNYQIEFMDPDKMLQWEDIVCVRFTAPSPIQCPICLEPPLCPQITACGHIYCFPCILRYLLMGEDDCKGECWKKCPLCFMAISSKDLYTVIIDHVMQYDVGDFAEFSLLSRPKGSFVPLEKNLQGLDAKSSQDDVTHSYSKFSLTSDVELSVREAKLSLQDWLVRAESGQVDDLERLPYVCAALEHLEKRMKGWLEHHVANCSPARSTISPLPKALSNDMSSSCQLSRQEVKTESKFDDISVAAENDNSEELHTFASESIGSNCSPGALDCASNSSEGHNERDLHKNEKALSSLPRDKDAEESAYLFYQITDGQQIVLHPLNMKCLLYHYDGYHNLPPRISGKILQLETVTQSYASRRRYRFISHFPLTTTFQICEIDLRDTLPSEAFVPFLDEIKKREKLRKQISKKERQEKGKLQDASFGGMPIESHLRFHDNGPTFSSDDFQALGSSAVPSTSPPVAGERKRFSDVTRLGFAAAHDSPSLGVESIEISHKMENGVSNTTGPGIPTLSFANIITAVAPESPAEQNIGNLVKKGKKHSKILLSTAGGRRY